LRSFLRVLGLENVRKNYARDIAALTDEELERFVLDWLRQKESMFVRVERFSGANDKGRDLVGYESIKLQEGAWHNYQCKQLLRSLGLPAALLEIGKILYHSSRGHFSLPARYVFVAPKGVTMLARKIF
jgi:hypothetical protein